MRKNYKKNLMVFFSLVVILLGCDDSARLSEQKNDDDKSNLNFGSVTADNPDSDRSIFDKAADYTLSNYVSDLYSFNNNITYTGKEITYRYHMKNVSELPVVETFFMTANGNMQPICFGQGEEQMSITVILQPGEEREVHISFDPIYAPFGKKGEMKMYHYSNVATTEELVSEIEAKGNDYTSSYIHLRGWDCKKIYIQADSKQNERIVELGQNKIGKDSPNIIPSDIDFTNGITFGEAYVKDTFDGMINLNVDWDRKDSLYARALCYGNENVRLFILSDGELIPAFDGQYFADFHQKKSGTVHNIELDTKALPKEGEHVLLGFIDYYDNEELGCDSIYPILLHVKE